MNLKKRYSLIKIIFFIIIAVTVVVAALTSSQIFELHKIKFDVFAIIKLSTPYIFLLIIPITLFNLFLRYLRWVFLLRNFNLIASSKDIFFPYLSSFFGNFFPLYLPYLIRLIPLGERVLSGMLILLLDLFLDFLSLYLIYKIQFINFYIIIFILLIIGIIIIAIMPSKGKGKINRLDIQIFGVIFSLILSIFIWLGTSFSMHITVAGFGYHIQYLTTAKFFAESLIVGSSSFIPGGILTTGKNMINSLQSTGIPLNIAVYSTIILRSLTFWFTLLISIISFFYYNKYLRNKRLIQHFDDISDSYQENIPEHIRLKLLEKKIKLNRNIYQ